jgi:hypothetical protein
MKKPGLAFVLNFLIAGAGLAYLGLWLWAVIDLAATLGIAFLVVEYGPDQLGLAGTLVPVINGVLALMIARSRNAS